MKYNTETNIVEDSQSKLQVNDPFQNIYQACHQNNKLYVFDDNNIYIMDQQEQEI